MTQGAVADEEQTELLSVTNPELFARLLHFKLEEFLAQHKATLLGIQEELLERNCWRAIVHMASPSTYRPIFGDDDNMEVDTPTQNLMWLLAEKAKEESSCERNRHQEDPGEDNT